MLSKVKLPQEELVYCKLPLAKLIVEPVLLVAVFIKKVPFTSTIARGAVLPKPVYPVVSIVTAVIPPVMKLRL